MRLRPRRVRLRAAGRRRAGSGLPSHRAERPGRPDPAGQLPAGHAVGRRRSSGFSGEVVLIGKEPHRPYELPALSKGILLGDATEPDWVHDEDFYTKNDIDLRLSTAIREVQLGEHAVVDDCGAGQP